MPLIRTLTNIAAGGQATPLAGNQYEYLPFPAQLDFAIVSDAAGVTATVYSGTDLLQQVGPASQKAANTPPVFPDDFMLTDVARAGERISILLNNSGAGAANVQCAVRITPL